MTNGKFLGLEATGCLEETESQLILELEDVIRSLEKAEIQLILELGLEKAAGLEVAKVAGQEVMVESNHLRSRFKTALTG